MIIDETELKRRYQLRIDGVRDNKVYIGPELVSLEIADPCTLRCQYCLSSHAPRDPNHSGKNRFLPWDKFINVVRDCIDLQVDQINIVGEGEPAMHPLFSKMIQHLEHQPIRTMLLTNATFSPEICLDVIKADYVLVNFGAVNREHYRRVHGGDYFDHVVENIKQLVHLRDSKKQAFLIDIAYIVNSLNVEQQEQMNDLADQMGVNKVQFIRMTPTQHNKHVALSEDSLWGEKKRVAEKCLNGWFYMDVTSDGKLSPCYKIYNMTRGDLNEESFKDVWFSAYMMKMRLLGKYGKIQKKYQVCQACSFYEENIGLLKNQRFLRSDLREATF